MDRDVERLAQGMDGRREHLLGEDGEATRGVFEFAQHDGASS
jgi:hypothetical protein